MFFSKEKAYKWRLVLAPTLSKMVNFFQLVFNQGYRPPIPTGAAGRQMHPVHAQGGAAIAAYYAPIAGQSVGRNDLSSCFSGGSRGWIHLAATQFHGSTVKKIVEIVEETTFSSSFERKERLETDLNLIITEESSPDSKQQQF